MAIRTQHMFTTLVGFPVPDWNVTIRNFVCLSRGGETQFYILGEYGCNHSSALRSKMFTVPKSYEVVDFLALNKVNKPFSFNSSYKIACSYKIWVCLKIVPSQITCLIISFPTKRFNNSIKPHVC